MPHNLVQSQDIKMINIYQYVEAILKKWWLIILIAVVLAYQTYASQQDIIPYYRASATFLVGYHQNENGLLSAASSDTSITPRMVSTYTEIMRSRGFSQKVVEELQLDLPASSIGGMISVSTLSSTDVLQISVTDTDPERAALIANSIMNIFKNEAVDMMELQYITILDEAIPNYYQINQPNNRDIFVSAMFGMLVAVSIALGLELFDSRVKTADEVSLLLGAPVIGNIPEFERSRKGVKKSERN